MELDATLYVDSPYQLPQLGAEHAFEWQSLGGDDVNLEPACHERRSDLEADEAGTDDHRRLNARDFADDCAAVLQCPQVLNPLAALDRKPDWARTRSNEENAIAVNASVAQMQRL